MRRLSIVAAAALLASAAPTLSAQDQPGGGRQGGGRGNQMAMLMQGITLSAEQQVKTDSVSQKYTGERQKLMQDQTMEMSARREKMMEMNTRMREEIKVILTDEQKKVFDKNVADMAARMGGGRPPA